MNVPDFAADCERMFLDWGQTAEFVEIVRSYDPETGRESESEGRTTITVIVLEDRPREQTQAKADVPLSRRQFLTRRTELPAEASTCGSRVIWQEAAYEVQALRRSAVSDLVVLECLANG